MSITIDFLTQDPSTKIGEVYSPVEVTALVSATNGISTSSISADNCALTFSAVDTNTVNVDLLVYTQGSIEITATDLSGNTVTSADSGYIYYDHYNKVATEDLKSINLKQYLPAHLEYSETGDFIEMFQGVLNELYYDNIEQNINPTSTSAAPEVRKISILEKIDRIADLHDPDEIDINFIQRLADYMGYGVDISRISVGNVVLDNPDRDGYPNYALDSEITRRYIRNTITNLPNWYKIKSTRNAVKVLLYSFGLVGDLVYNWTSDVLGSTDTSPNEGGYGNDDTKWFVNDDSLDDLYDVSNVPSDYFPTPHFTIKVSLNDVPPQWINNIDEVINAIESIRPINNVLDDVALILKETHEQNMLVWEYENDGIYEEFLYEDEPTVYIPDGEVTVSAGETLAIEWTVGWSISGGPSV